MDGEGNSRSREAMEAARQFAAFAAAAAAAVPPPPQQAFYPSAAGITHPWPPAFASDPAFAWFANLAAAAAAAQGGGGPSVSMPHMLPSSTGSAIQQLPSTAAASLAQLPSGGLPPYDRYQASRGWLQRMAPGSPWPLMLPSPHHSLMTPGIPWPLYRHGLSSAATSPFSSRGASPSEDYRTGQRPPVTSSAATSGQRVNDAGDQPSLQEPQLLGSGRHAFRSAGLHAFVPYSRSNTASPLASSTVGTDTCLDLSMPRAAGDRPRAPPSAARGAPSPPMPAEVEASPTVPSSGASAATSGPAAGCSRAMPMKGEREGSSKRSSIPVGIAVAWQRRQDTGAELTTVMPKADAPGQQPVTATQSKAPVPGVGDGQPMPDQPGLLKVKAAGLENGSPASNKPALLAPSLGLFGLPLSLALPAEPQIKTNRTVPTKDLPHELILDPLPRLHQPAGPAATVSDAAMQAAQHLLTAAIPKTSTVNGMEPSMTINVKTEDSSVTHATFPIAKLGATQQQQQWATEQEAGLRGINATSSLTVPNAATLVLEAESVSAEDANSCKAAANEGRLSSPLDPGNVAQCKDTSPSCRGNNEDAPVAAADPNIDTTPDTGRVLRAAIRSRDAAKDGSGTASAVKQAGSATANASAAAAGSMSRSKNKGKAPRNKKTARKPAGDGVDYSVIVYNGIKYHPLRDRELQNLCKRLKERQRTLARSVRSYAGKLDKLDLMDELDEAASNDDDDDGPPSAGPSPSCGTANGSSADKLAGPKQTLSAAAADGLTMPGVFGIASAGVGGRRSCQRNSRKSDNKRRDVAERSPTATPAALTVAASPKVAVAAVVNGNAGERNPDVSAPCTASGSSRVVAAAPAAASSAATSHTATMELRVSADDLVEGARLLVFIRGLPHEATVVCIEPPSVYGVLLVGQRSARPRVYARDDLLRDAYRDVQPAGVEALTPGSRVCAYWSNQFGYLYPGVVTAIYNTEAATAFAAAATTSATGACMTGVVSPSGSGIAVGSGHASSSCRSARGSIGSRSHAATGALTSACTSPFVDITFDDGDSGKFPLEQIRLLPADFPHTPVPHQQGYDDDLSVVPVERRRSLSRTTSVTAAASSSSSAAPAAVRSPTSSSSDSLSPTKREHGCGATSRHQPTCSVTSVCTATSSTAATGAAAADEGDVFEDSDDEPLHMYKAKRARESFVACDGEWVWSGQPTRRRESSSGSSQGRQRHREIKDFYKEIRRGDEMLKVGDCAVFVRREEDKPPYVGKILSMWQGRRSHRMVVKVQWFYHPEETSDFSERVVAANGEPDLCGALFESEHVDENSVQTISHRCRVLPMAEYHKEGLHMRPLAELMQHTAFYIAGKYDAAHSQVVSFLSMSGMAAANN